MRSAALALAFAGCSDPEGSGAAVVMAVGSLDLVSTIEVQTLDVDDPTAQAWRDEPIDVPRENFVTTDSEFDPLRIRVDVPHAGHWVVRVVGRGAEGTLQYTGCYTVSGVVEDDFVVMGRLGGNDEDADDSPDDEAAYCAMLEGAGTACLESAELGFCPPTFVYDCDPSVARVHPLALEECGNGEDENCDLADAPCVDCDRPENRDLPECSGECGVCNPPDGCCGDACVDLTSSVANCGACGTTCSDRTDSCEDGLCTCGGGGPCGTASVCVGGACECDEGRGDCDEDPGNGCETDLNFDSNHCGDCETICPASCFDGTCDS